MLVIDLGVIGALGFGLAWGWLMADRVRRTGLRPRLVAALVAATGLTAAVVGAFAGVVGVIFYTVAVVAGATSDLIWIRSLQERSGSATR